MQSATTRWNRSSGNRPKNATHDKDGSEEGQGTGHLTQQHRAREDGDDRNTQLNNRRNGLVQPRKD